MSRSTLRAAAIGGGVASASLALLAGTLAPVHAAAYAQIELDPYASTYVNGGSCTLSSPAPSPAEIAITPNQAAAATTVSINAGYTANGDPTDVLTQSVTIAATGRATSVGDRPTSITLGVSGSTSTSSTLPTSSCSTYTYAGTDVDYDFTLTAPTWVDFSMSRKGPMYTEVYLYLEDADPYIDTYGREVDGNARGTYLLKPGRYRGYLEGEIRTYGSTASATRKGSAALSLVFAPVGSANAKPSGKAKPYASLPSARTCATHDAKAKLTSNAKRAKKISSVVYKVNGRKVATLKGKKVAKAKLTSLKIADDKAAKVEALVTLKNGKKLSTKASYLACTI